MEPMLAKVQDEDSEERFQILIFDAESGVYFPAGSPLSEASVRRVLENAGMSPADIDSKIGNARSTSTPDRRVPRL